MGTSDIIENSQALTSVLGYWPSFHDANVVAAARGEDFQSVSIHVFTMTDRLDAKGYFELVNHHVVELLFKGVEQNTLPQGYSSDCLDHLAFSSSYDQVRVSFQSHLDGAAISFAGPCAWSRSLHAHHRARSFRLIVHSSDRRQR